MEKLFAAAQEKRKRIKTKQFVDSFLQKKKNQKQQQKNASPISHLVEADFRGVNNLAYASIFLI